MVYFKNLAILTFLVFLIICSSITQLYAQKKSEWGEISKKELKKKVYAIDSSANAVVLFDKAELDFDSEFNFIMKRHVRIKFLDQDGFDKANISIAYWDDLDQDVKEIKAVTYNLEKGKINKNKMDNDAVFEEQIAEDYYKIKFTLPDIREGSIVEYKYKKILSGASQIPNWEFQRDIPVLWSELQITAPTMMRFVTYLQGSKPFDVQKADTRTDYRTIKYEYTQQNRIAPQRRQKNSTFRLNITDYRWVIKNLEPLEKVDYVRSIDNHRSKLWIQLKTIDMGSRGQKEQLGSWETLVTKINEWKVMDKYLYKKTYFEDQLSQLINDNQNEQKQIETIYNFIQKAISWNGKVNIYTEEAFDDILEKGEGSSADINLTLVKMLKEAGFEAYPVIISTQENGNILEVFPMADQFNLLIAAVKYNDNYILMDARTKNNPYHLLPISDLNGRGFLIKENTYEWVSLTNHNKSNRSIIADVKLDVNTKLSGSFIVESNGYLGLHDNSKNEEMGLKEYCEKELLDSFQTVEIDTVSKDSDFHDTKTFSLSLSFEGEGPVQKIGDAIYIKPVFHSSLFSNPFVQPKRNYPVYFNYPYEYQLIYNFRIPESYHVESIPKPIRYNLPEEMMTFTRIIREEGHRIQVMVKYSLNNTSYNVKGYTAIRKYLSKVDEFANQQIVLKEM